MTRYAPPMTDTPPARPTPQPQAVVCPYCGQVTTGSSRCSACSGRFDPLSRQATQNAMGPWFILDRDQPTRPGCSFEVLCSMIARAKVTPDTVLRGPTTRQFWTLARHTPGIAHLLGICHNCAAAARPGDYACAQCGAVFEIDRDRQHLGLGPVRQVPGRNEPLPQAPAPAAAPAQTSNTQVEPKHTPAPAPPAPPPHDPTHALAARRAARNARSRRNRRIVIWSIVGVCVFAAAVVGLVRLFNGVGTGPAVIPTEPAAGVQPAAPEPAQTTRPEPSPIPRPNDTQAAQRRPPPAEPAAQPNPESPHADLLARARTTLGADDPPAIEAMLAEIDAIADPSPELTELRTLLDERLGVLRLRRLP